MTPWAIAAFFLLQQTLQRAESLLREHRVEEAAAAATEVLAKQPDSVPALILRGRIAMAANDFPLARTLLTKAASLAPDSAGPHFLLGFFHYVDNDFQQARPVLERARKLAPKDPQAALFLALTYEGLALPALARPAFLDAILLEESRKTPATAATARIAFARMLFTQGLFDEARTHITRALVIDANSRDAHYENARLHFAGNRFPDCIAEATKALALEGDGVTERSLHHLLSRAYDRTGNKQQASEHRKQFEAIPPRMIR